MKRHSLAALAAVLGCGLWLLATPAQAQCPPGGCGSAGGPAAGCSPYTACPDCQRLYYYPFYYFPHNYWPTHSPQWPEPAGKCYTPPPAYMAYPPFKEPNWRYEYWQPQRYYRGSHFLLDIF